MSDFASYLSLLRLTSHHTSNTVMCCIMTVWATFNCGFLNPIQILSPISHISWCNVFPGLIFLKKLTREVYHGYQIQQNRYTTVSPIAKWYGIHTMYNLHLLLHRMHYGLKWQMTTPTLHLSLIPLLQNPFSINSYFYL